MNDKAQFVVCVRNPGYEGALDLRKLYELVVDPVAERHNQVRVVDESGEDYLYPADWFVAVEVSATAEEQLLSLAGK